MTRNPETSRPLRPKTWDLPGCLQQDHAARNRAAVSHVDVNDGRHLIVACGLRDRIDSEMNARNHRLRFGPRHYFFRELA